MLIEGNQPNGEIPAIDVFRNLDKALSIALNGIATTLLIPSISVLTIVLNVSATPSLIPVNTFPPLLNTFFTLVQAVSNVLLNQDAVVPKLD